MAVMDHRRWRRRRLRAGRIVPDDDATVPHHVRDARFRRYLELVAAVDGTEGPGVFGSLVDSLQVRHDHGAYQRTLAVLDRFPRERFAEWLLPPLPRLIRRQPRWAGDLLCRFVCLRADRGYVAAFNRCLRRASPVARAAVLAFIEAEEAGGWLQDHPGVLRPDDRW